MATILHVQVLQSPSRASGRAKLSIPLFASVAHRPVHSQVVERGMAHQQPHAGIDLYFSTIPVYFIRPDIAAARHSWSNETGGGRGRLVRLGTIPGCGGRCPI